MGTTRAALHLACTEGARLRDRVIDAGQRLGWRLEDADGEPGSVRRIALHYAKGDPCATIVVAGNDRIDDGTLKEFAAALSRETGMPAAVTGIDDSDEFDVILYAEGRQIDALGAAAAEPDSGLRLLAAGERGSVWSRMYGRPLGPVPTLPESPFAEEAVDAIMSWIGVDPAMAHLSYDDLAAQSSMRGDISLFTFVQAEPTAARGAQERADPPILAVVHDDDDCRPHRVYPAHWRLTPHKASGLRWLIRSSGAGFEGARVTFKVDDASGAAIQTLRLSMQAYPFFNGQVTSAIPVATHEATVSGTLAEGVWSQDAPSFAMPDLEPEAGKHLVILLRLECLPETGARARLRPAFQPLGRVAEPIELPPVRIVAGNVDWRPIGSDAAHLGEAYRESLLLELNTPSVLSVVAILNGDDEEIRASVRAAAEAWLGSMARASDCSAAVLTKKHMTASGSVTKKHVDLPLSGLVVDPGWKRWFGGKADLQTLRVEVMPSGAFRPCAGFVMQAALREFSIGGDPRPVAHPALHVAFWTNDHPESWAAIGMTRQAWLDQLETWVERCDVLQAYRTSTAGIPAFDSYEQYGQTVYEELSGVDWFRQGLQGRLMTGLWCGETVRSVAPRMWLSHPLAERLAGNLPDVGASAVIAPMPGMVRVSLKEGIPIAALERAMSPILPSAR